MFLPDFEQFGVYRSPSVLASHLMISESFFFSNFAGLDKNSVSKSLVFGCKFGIRFLNDLIVIVKIFDDTLKDSFGFRIVDNFGFSEN